MSTYHWEVSCVFTRFGYPFLGGAGEGMKGQGSVFVVAFWKDC